MPPIIIPNTSQVTCSGPLGNGEVWANVFHIRHDILQPFNTQAAAAASEFVGFYGSISDRMADNWGLTQIIVRDLHDSTPNTPYILPVSTISGTGAGFPLPLQVALVISWRTALNSRRGRGRTYLAGFEATSLTNVGSLVSETTRTDIEAAAQDLVDDLDSLGTPLCVASRLDLESREVTSFSVGQHFDTQRGRRDRLPG